MKSKVPHFKLGYLYQGDTLHAINVTVDNENLTLSSVNAQWQDANGTVVYQCDITVNDNTATVNLVSADQTLNFPVGELTLGVQGMFDNGHTHTLFTAGIKVLKAVVSDD